MPKEAVHYPHRVGYRLDDEAWVKLENVVAGTGLSPHDWCRMAALEKLNDQLGLTRSERFIFAHVVRTQYLVGIGFQMLADHRLNTEEWKKLRAFAKDEIDVITDRALSDFESRTKGETRKVASGD
jgi:hypothetical protein